jgi:hypothetical protein
MGSKVGCAPACYGSSLSSNFESTIQTSLKNTKLHKKRSGHHTLTCQKIIHIYVHKVTLLFFSCYLYISGSFGLVIWVKPPAVTAPCGITRTLSTTTLRFILRSSFRLTFPSGQQYVVIVLFSCPKWKKFAYYPTTF